MQADITNKGLASFPGKWLQGRKGAVCRYVSDDAARRNDNSDDVLWF